MSEIKLARGEILKLPSFQAVILALPRFQQRPAATMASCVQQCRPVAVAQRPALRAPSRSSAFAGSSIPRTHLRASTRPAARRMTTMGLFGLGVPELAVIAGVAALIFGARVPQRAACRCTAYSLARCHYCPPALLPPWLAARRQAGTENAVLYGATRRP